MEIALAAGVGVVVLALVIGLPVLYAWNVAGKSIERDRQRKKQNALEAQAALGRDVTSLAAEIDGIAGILPLRLSAVDACLRRAEGEFEERAFAPFWDEIEMAARELAMFDLDVRTIRSNLEQHGALSRQLEAASPQPVMRLAAIPQPGSYIDRLKALVRAGQTDYRFASIYEQRKTNQLLVRGFTGLGEALRDLGSRLEGSIDSLAYAMEGQEHTTAAVGSSVEGLRGDLERERRDRRSGL